MRVCILFLILCISEFSWGQASYVGYQWNLQFEGKSNSYIQSSACDKDGNVFLSGQFMDSIQVHLNSNVFSYVSKGLYDCFIAKISAGGQLLWFKTFGGVGSDQINKIHITNSGHIVLVGSFKDTCNFSTDSMPYNLGASNTHADMFVAKYDANGAVLWAKSFGNPSSEAESCNDVLTDTLGNIYTGGYFANSVDFDPGSGTRFVNPSGTADAFIQKLDSNGNFINLVNAGINRRIYAMKMHPNGYIVYAGVSTAGANGYQICVSMVRPNGVAEWTRTTGSTAYDAATAIQIDAEGLIYCTGQFQGTVVFGPSHTLTNNPAAAFLWKLNDKGFTSWAKKVSGPWSSSKTATGKEIALSQNNIFWIGNGYEINTQNALYAIYDTVGTSILSKNFSSQLSNNQSGSLCADANGNAYLSLNFDDSIDVNLGQAKTFVTSSGLIDNVLLKMNLGKSTFDTLVVNDCMDYFGPDGKFYYNTGKYNLVVPNEFNWDKNVYLDYTKHPSYDIFLGMFTACNSFIFPDSTIKNGPGMYNYRKIHKSFNGCDSIISLTVNISKSEPIYILKVGGKLIAQQGHTAYQWLNCDKSYLPINGANKFEFEPDTSGNYAVLITNGICIDTSECFYIDVNTTGLNNTYSKQNILIFPNPNKGVFTIDFGTNNIQPKQVIVRDILGNIWLNQTFESAIIEIEKELAKGLYILEIIVGSDREIEKIWIE